MFDGEESITAPVAATLAQLSAALDTLTTLDLTRLSRDELLELLRDFEVQRRRLPVVDHALIAELNQRGTAGEMGARDTHTLLRDVLPRSEVPVLNLVMALESFGLPVVGPAGIPPARLAVLRSAFMAMCNDKQYQDDARRVDLPAGAPLDGAQVTAMMGELKASATPDIVAAYKRLGAPA